MSATLRKTKLSKVIGFAGKVPVHSFFGAEDPDPNANSSGAGDNSGGGNDNGGEDPNTGKTPEQIEAEEAKQRANSEAKARRLENDRLKQENADLKKAQEDAARKEKSDLENTQKDLTAATESLTKREQVLERNLVETAILKFADFTWHDVDLVVAALNKDEIKVDLDTGAVTGHEDELKRIAKDKPFLVASSKKQKKEDQNNGGNNGQQNQQRGASGSNPGGAGQQQVNQAVANREKLISSSPALRALGRR